jgi:hypothetical protein
MKHLFLLFLILLLFILNLKNNKTNTKENFNNIKKNENKKIICFSLWGNNECYNWGALENALLAQKIYPEWICRFYIGRNVIPEMISKLQKLNNVELVYMNEHKSMGNTFWRFSPVFEEDYEVYLSRDTDSRLNIREKAAVDEWLKGKKNICIIRDHKYHNEKIMAGMFGARNSCLKKYKNLFLESLNKPNEAYFSDQLFLRNIYDKVKEDSLIFDNHNHFKNEKLLNIPETNFKGYIGEIVCDNFDEIKKKYGLEIKKVDRKRDF